MKDRNSERKNERKKERKKERKTERKKAAEMTVPKVILRTKLFSNELALTFTSLLLLLLQI